MYTSASTLVFKTFACDDSMGGGKSYLRADYRLSCGSNLHTFFRGYAVLMVLVRKLARDRAWGFDLFLLCLCIELDQNVYGCVFCVGHRSIYIGGAINLRMYGAVNL